MSRYVKKKLKLQFAYIAQEGKYLVARDTFSNEKIAWVNWHANGRAGARNTLLAEIEARGYATHS